MLAPAAAAHDVDVNTELGTLPRACLTRCDRQICHVLLRARAPRLTALKLLCCCESDVQLDQISRLLKGDVLLRHLSLCTFDTAFEARGHAQFWQRVGRLTALTALELVCRMPDETERADAVLHARKALPQLTQLQELSTDYVFLHRVQLPHSLLSLTMTGHTDMPPDWQVRHCSLIDVKHGVFALELLHCKPFGA